MQKEVNVIILGILVLGVGFVYTQFSGMSTAHTLETIEDETEKTSEPVRLHPKIKS